MNGLLVGIGTVAIAAVAAAFSVVWRRSSAIGTEEGANGEELPRQTQSATLESDRQGEETSSATEPTAASIDIVQRIVEVSPEQAGVTRRRFFNRALGATWFTFVGVLSLDFLAFLWPKLSGGFGSDVNVGLVQDLLAQTVNEDGNYTPVFIPEARAYVVPAVALGPQFGGKGIDVGGVMALWQRCVHLGCRVPWCQTSQGFECPCHGSKYSLLGEYFAGPAPRNLDRFVVELNRNDELIIKTGSIIQTPRAKVLVSPYPQGPSCIGEFGG